MFAEDGAIKKAVEAREATDIASEKDIVSMSVIAVKTENKEMTQENLQEAINNTTGNTDTRVEDIGDGSFLVFFPSGRVYEVDENGNVKYAGKENEIDKVIVTADKESDLEPKQIQQVQINIKKYNAKAEDTITMEYAWSTSKTEEPAVYKKAQFEEDKEAEEEGDEGDIDEGENTDISTSNKTAIIDSGEQITGNYYLWIKVNVGSSQEIKRTYGEYKIQEFLTLVGTSDERTAESGFLGSKDVNKGDIKNITRGKIKSITITNTISGHSEEDENCWDVGNKQHGDILAWYEKDKTTTGEEYYKVTIGRDGGIQANANSRNLFRNIGSNLDEEVKIEGLENLDTSKVIDMSYMFKNCTKLKNLNLDKFKTDSSSSMESMFEYCSSLENIDLSSFNTTNVVRIVYMFRGCSSLEALDLSNFVTNKVTNMHSIFRQCSNLRTLNIENFDTKNVTIMACMFSGCSNLESIDLESFDTSNVTNMMEMFIGCSNLKSLNINNFNTKSVENMNSMFRSCSSLTNLDLKSFNTSNVKSMRYMFYKNNALTNLDLRNWIINKETDATGIFESISSDCVILVSTQEMRDWVLRQNSKLNNVEIMDSEGNIIENKN